MPEQTALPSEIVASFRPILVREIELTQPLPGLNLTCDGVVYDSAYLVVLIAHQPVAACTVDCTSEASTLLPAQVADAIWEAAQSDINAWLSNNGLPSVDALPVTGLTLPHPPKIVAELAALESQSPHITITVCTKDRTDWLKTSIPTLLAQNYPNFDVVVIDNNPSTSATEDYLQTIYGDDPRIRYVREPSPRLSIARNRGIAEARGEIIAMSDDDVRVAPNWLLNIAHAFQKYPHVACVTGSVFPGEIETPAQLWFEQFLGGFNRGFVPRVYDLKENRPDRPFFFPYLPGIFGTGANMSFRADAVRKVGGFSPYLGPGSPSDTGEDLDLFFRVVDAGYGLAYVPGAYLYHYHRREFDALVRQIETYGRGSMARLTKWFIEKPTRLPGFLLKLPYIPYVLLFSPSTDNLRRRKYQATIPPQLKQAERRGMLRGPFAYIQSLLTPLPTAR